MFRRGCGSIGRLPPSALPYDTALWCFTPHDNCNAPDLSLIHSPPYHADGALLRRCLDPSIAFLNLHPTKHTATLIDAGTHALSFTTLRWAADAIVSILQHPEASANRVFPVRAFEASQRDILHLLEKVQGVKYQVSDVKSADVIQQANADLDAGNEERMGNAIVELIKVGFVAEGYGSNLVKDGRVPIGSDLLGLKGLDAEEVVREAIATLG